MWVSNGQFLETSPPWAGSVEDLTFKRDYWSVMYDPARPVQGKLRYYEAFDLESADVPAHEQLKRILEHIHFEDRKYGPHHIVCGYVPGAVEPELRKTWDNGVTCFYKCHILRASRDQLRDCEYIAKHRLKTATGSGSQDSAVAGGVVNTDSVDSLGDTAVGKRDRTLDDQSMGSNSADGVVVEHAHVDDLDDIMELVGETGLTSRRNYLMGMLQCKDWPTWCIRNEDGRVVAFCLMHRDGRTVGGLAVHPACRRRGYARALVHAVCKSYWANFTTDASRGEPADAHLKRKAHGERYLYAIVSFDNTASISTFTSLGFEQLPDHWYWLGRDQ